MYVSVKVPSNALILGHQVNVGIGTSTPVNRLEVVSGAPNASGLTLTNLTTASPSTRTTDQFLTVSETGEVIKARYRLRINNPSEWSDIVFSPLYCLPPLAQVSSYIQQHGHLPGIPPAEQVVKEGVDLVRMNATLLEKVEELTLYSIQLEKTNRSQQIDLETVKRQHQQVEKRTELLEKELTDLKRLVKQLLEK